MRLLRNVGLAVLALAIPVSVSAQVNYYEYPPAPTPGPGVTGYLDYQGYKASHAGDANYIINNGYKGALGGDTFDMYCVDPETGPRDGTVYVTPLWAAGNFTGSQYTYKADRDMYRQAAWLVGQFTYTDPDDYANNVIQGAIWKLMAGAALPSGFMDSAGQQADIDAKIVEARNNYMSVDMDRYAILSGVNYPDTPYGQEYMVQVTPEPATLLLLFTGLAGIAGVAYRRREDGDDG